MSFRFKCSFHFKGFPARELLSHAKAQGHREWNWSDERAASAPCVPEERGLGSWLGHSHEPMNQ